MWPTDLDLVGLVGCAPCLRQPSHPLPKASTDLTPIVLASHTWVLRARSNFDCPLDCMTGIGSTWFEHTSRNGWCWKVLESPERSDETALNASQCSIERENCEFEEFPLRHSLSNPKQRRGDGLQWFAFNYIATAFTKSTCQAVIYSLVIFNLILIALGQCRRRRPGKCNAQPSTQP